MRVASDMPQIPNIMSLASEDESFVTAREVASPLPPPTPRSARIALRPSPHSTRFQNRQSTSPPPPPLLPSSFRYRPAKDLPFELREHCTIYFEEELFTHALTLLTQLLTAGDTTPNAAPTPAFVPPPSLLAVILTIAIHPSFNTRARSPDKLNASNLACQYLRLLEKTVGPVHSRLNEAYTFAGPETTSRRGGATRKRQDTLFIENDDGLKLNVAYASTTSLWARANDFWAVVGWAFNCSVAHKKRWERWQLWLEYMLDVLEDGWRAASDSEKEDTLLFRYITALANAGVRRLVRAAFADAAPQSLAEFKEIWNNETRPRKKHKDPKPQKKLDIEEGNYGDYLVSDSSSDEADQDPLSSTNIEASSPPPHEQLLRSDTIKPGANNTFPDPTTPLGGPVALQLRLRLLALLTTFSLSLPQTLSPTTLYDSLLSHIRPLPVPTFSILLSPTTLSSTGFSAPAASSLLQYVARSLLESSAPTPKVDEITQEVLQSSYLPWAANVNGAGPNAKVSICVEGLLAMFETGVGIKWSKELEECVTRGVKRREERGGKRDNRGRKKVRDANGNIGDEMDVDAVEWAVLNCSGVRIKALAERARGRRGTSGGGMDWASAIAS